MSEEVEVYDRTKVFALIIGLVSAGVLIYFFTMVIDFNEIGFNEVQLEVPIILEPGKDGIKDDYIKFLDFGISGDDIVDIQSTPCEIFSGNQSSLLSADNKYKVIFDQRRNECGL